MSQDVLSIIASFFGSFGFAIIYNIRGRRVLIPAIGGAVFWAVYLVFLHFVNNEYLGFFVVAILITIYSEIWARMLKDTGNDGPDADGHPADPGRFPVLCDGRGSPA